MSEKRGHGLEGKKELEDEIGKLQMERLHLLVFLKSESHEKTIVKFEKEIEAIEKEITKLSKELFEI